MMARSAFTGGFLLTLKGRVGALQDLLGHWGTLIRIACVSDCCQWPSQSILWFLYIPVVCWEHSTTVCGLMAGRARLRLAHPPPPPPYPLPPTHPLISAIGDITVAVKNYLTNQQ